ncbi:MULTISPECIES: hypothetical protein [Geomicrobium]|uniref:Uncharacterized protein n=1 Tax=Geomicrobium sediminis TaxID=1347788 RepID=A0ABS2PDR5_9BACL|nr:MULTISPECIES: hypothetical protein [Geomicrobium]MBM7633564.1 hypothetical protein [Geomicrobium sediminis]
MCRTTLKDHLLIFDEDLHFNQRIGMPVQVFCLTQQRVVAFGKIQNISNKCVTVSKTAFLKSHYAVIGHSKATKKSLPVE